MCLTVKLQLGFFLNFLFTHHSFVVTKQDFVCHVMSKNVNF